MSLPVALLEVDMPVTLPVVLLTIDNPVTLPDPVAVEPTAEDSLVICLDERSRMVSHLDTRHHAVDMMIQGIFFLWNGFLDCLGGIFR